MFALADPAQDMRCAFSIGLRTLTLQTGKAFRMILNQGDDDLASRVSGSGSKALFEHPEQQAESTGSAHSQRHMHGDAHVGFEGNIGTHPFLSQTAADPDIRKLLMAPLLVCTIDQLTGATESQHGGLQMASVLHPMSADLVLDETDDFDLADLPALTRLVHWTVLLGARVLLSPATLPPTLVQGLFEAYRNGRKHFNRNCGARPSAADAVPVIGCARIDDHHRQGQDGIDVATFEQVQGQFPQRRQSALARLSNEPCRRAELQPLHNMQGIKPEDLPLLAQVFAPHVLAAALRMHITHNDTDLVSHKHARFVWVRMINIEPLLEVVHALFRQVLPKHMRKHLCVYHSRHSLLVRSGIEKQLDQTQQRHDVNTVFGLPDYGSGWMHPPSPITFSSFWVLQ